ncbi:ankyrin repeat domain-containing protein [Burkholderia cenocepacia]|uniref:ankyrin repeat domain-containing protein n=1 Tax=Burkholderia cenocepacia TaxID=95486 RepID=UPI001BA00556|nr:ankyrin repeat domain-containing protein [Burkholderia cenocepacia]MBR8384571.1 ankyrin repeat domain-containing protein [Burkholderia cenocepacia]
MTTTFDLRHLVSLSRKVARRARPATRVHTIDDYNEYLRTAVRDRNLKLLHLALRAGADPLHDGTSTQSFVHQAVYTCFPEGVEALIEAGYPVNAEDGYSKRTLLHSAAMFGDAALVRTLLKHGATIDKPDACGVTPLHSAAWQNNADTITALCEAGATVNARDDDNATPLRTAALRLAPKAVKALIEAGADVNADSNGGTPLFIAVTGDNDTRWESSYHRSGGLRNDVRILRALLDAGAEPTQTVLAEAVSSNNTLAMRALVRAGADPTTVEPGRHADANEALEELVAKYVKHQARALRDALDADAEPVAMPMRSRL